MRVITFVSLLATVFSQGFNYESNGSDWGGICSSGELQSPIKIESGTINKIIEEDNLDYLKLTYEYKSIFKSVQYNAGYGLFINSNFGNLKITGDSNSTLGGIYRAEHIRMRYPAEHNISYSSDSFDESDTRELELQIEHRRETDGKVLIVSVIYKVGWYFNKFIDQFIFSKENIGGGDIDLSHIIPGFDYLKDFYLYDGSYTTPDCLENVTWVVYSKKVSVDAVQMDVFNKLLEVDGVGNNRILQDIGEREVIRYISNRELENSSDNLRFFAVLLAVNLVN